jgi:glycosyltransferase involved in cell wall biosynthesis
MQLSVVIPCLNESDTIATCVENARSTIAELDSESEVIVADNGSVDGSQALALAAGARIVPVPEKGYGNALMGGIDAAKGRYVILGDADDSYDFRQIPLFLEKLRAGNELVVGCRLPSGGGQVLPGAMPWLHRWLGNPMFSLLARSWFHAPIHDVNCGMRGLSKDLYRRLEQRCTGMAFATEMVIKACLLGAKIAELPVTLKPDGRKNHPPHLRTFRDGWDTLRVFLYFNPRTRLFTKLFGLHHDSHPPSGPGKMPKDGFGDGR